MEKLNLSLDLQRALALFMLLESTNDADRQEQAGIARDDLNQLDELVRNYLYNNLSIADMEKPEKLYLSLLKRKI